MSKAQSTMTEILRASIKDSGLSAYRISKDTGLVVTSIIRFVEGETSLRLDKADMLAEYLGLQLTLKPTAHSLARPMPAKHTAKSKEK